MIFIIDIGYVSLMLIRTVLTQSFDSQNMNISFIGSHLRNVGSILLNSLKLVFHEK